MATIRRCDECGKDLPAWGAITVTQNSPHGSGTFSMTGLSGHNPADLCDWQCLARYADKRSNNPGTTYQINYVNS